MKMHPRFLNAILTLVISVGIAQSSAFGEEKQRTKLDTNREVISTYAKIYVEQKDYGKAEELISEYLYLQKDDVDGNLWAQLGQIQMSERKLPQACHSLQKATAMFKLPAEKIYSEYSFADCLNRGGRTEEATKVLNQLVKDEEGVSNAAEKALELIRAGVIRPGNALPPYALRAKGQLRVTGSIGSGFDSNVLLVEDNVASGTPIANRGSFFLAPAAQVGYVGRLFGDTFDSRYVAAFTDYFNSLTKNYNSLYQRADFVIGSGPIRWGLYADMYDLNKTTGFGLYDYELGATWILLKELTPESSTTIETPLQYQHYNRDSVTDDNVRTGADLKVKYTKRYMLSEREMFSIQGTLDNQYTTGKNYRIIGLDCPVFYMSPMPFIEKLGFVNTFSADVQYQMYYSADSKRKDLLFKAGVGLLRPIATGYNMTLDYSYLKNTSNVTEAKYTKGVITLQISHEFI